MKKSETPENQLFSDETTLAKLDAESKDDALTVLRTETALSRFPLHRIAKKSGDIAIEINNQAAAVQWSVSHNTKYGQPGPLAYRIDTLLVNRRIEEAGKPVPRLIKLGSLPQIAKELGFTGHNWSQLRRAIHQNASAYITAKISYLGADRTQRFLEAGFNRYNVIFTGEKLPSGEVAGAVYLVLSDIFLDVLNTAMWRPLDYEYMKTLPPGSQRFYEIVSYQIYAALRHKNPRAKLAYSEYCLLSTATRYFDFEHVKKQMYKILRPHIQSGYLAKVEYEATVNEQGEADWIMYLTPGPNASREYHAFTGQAQTRKPGKRGAKTKRMAAIPTLPFADEPSGGVPSIDRPSNRPPFKMANLSEVVHTRSQCQSPTEPNTGVEQDLIEDLTEAELNRSDAERLAREKPKECRRQLEYLSHITEFKTSRGAYLRRAIEEGYGPPKGYSQTQARAVADQEAKQRRARELFEASQEQARKRHQKGFYGAYVDYLRERAGELQKEHPEALAAFEQSEDDERIRLTTGPFAGRPLNQKALEVLNQESNHLERVRDYCRQNGLEVFSFWEWDEHVNPESFQF